MPSDRHEMPTVSHDVAEDRKVAVVHVAAIKLDNSSHLAYQLVPGCLNAKHIDDLNHVVADGSGVVHLGVAQHPLQVDALRVKHPLLDLLVSRLAPDNVVRPADEDLGDPLDALQLQLREHVCLDLPQEHVLILRIGVLVSLLPSAVHHADAQDELFGIVVIEDASEIVLKLTVDLLCHIRHGKLLVNHHVAVELDPQKPWAHPRGVELLIRHLKVALHKLAILVNDCVRRLGVVVDLRGRSDLGKGRVLEGCLHALCVDVVPRVPRKVHRQGRCLDVLGDIDDLCQAGHPEGDILAADTGKVERVERHLGGWLANGLSGKGADHFARVSHGLHELGLHLAQDPVEGLLGELELPENPLGVERAPEHVEEQQRGVILSLDAQGVLPADHDELLRELPHSVDHIEGVEAADLRSVLPDAKHHLGVPDEPREVHREENVGLPVWNDLRPHRLEVLSEVVPLHVDQLPSIHVGAEVVQGLLLEPIRRPPRGIEVVPELVLELLLVKLQRRKLLVLDALPVHAVLTVQELDHVPAAVADRPVVLDHDILHGLHQAALDVAGRRGLDCSVDEALPASHGVEEELLRRESPEVRVLDKAAGLRAIIIGCEVGQGAPRKTVGDPLPLHVLLPDAGNHL
mmetsp:Transcript_13686/g.32412  ORF Transcript_13686/g.32412 Transcript_13686/m.32412 type:complete len:631 (+) Transcript_13686:410-2302(+)